MARTGVLSDDLARHVRDRILSGEYGPGDSISETGVANEYGVARPTARSALDRLVVDGLLVRHAHASLRVREVSADDLREIVEILEFLEGCALERLLRTNADLREIKDAADSSIHNFLHVLTSSSGSDRLGRFHRQSTFEFLLGAIGDGQSGAPAEVDDVHELMTATVDALWRGQEEEASMRLAALWAHRRSLVRTLVQLGSS